MVTEKEIISETEKKTGRIIAVCLSDRREYPKYPQEKVTIGRYGIVGDAHAGELRSSYSNPAKLKSNDRAISIVSDEVRQHLNDTLGINILPGGFNENILVVDMGDLSDLNTGDKIFFSSGVVLQVTGQNDPCIKLENYHRGAGIIKELAKNHQEGKANRRGIIATVVEPGELKPSDTFEILKTNL